MKSWRNINRSLVALIGLWIGLVFSCEVPKEAKAQNDPLTIKADPKPEKQEFSLASIQPCDGFDFPVGPPNAKGYYNAQKFGKNNHLGDDWNGTGGGNSDLGDPVYAVAGGYVSQAYQAGPGWGNVMRIIHNIGTDSVPQYVESLYAHLDTMLVKEKSTVKRGQKIGTIGNAGGIYYAHLHLEIRKKPFLDLGGGYSSGGAEEAHFVDPTKFIKAHRPNLNNSQIIQENR